jgi:hypothetical protein
VKSEKEILDYLYECEEYINGNTPLELEDWAHWEGQKKAILWIMDMDDNITKVNNKVDQILEGANDETIKRAQERLSKETGFGQKSSTKEPPVEDDYLYQEQQGLYGCTS